MMRFDSKFAARSESDTSSVRHAPEPSRNGPANEKFLQDCLTVFLDLGLTPHEMSRLSGFPLIAIRQGLTRREGAGCPPRPAEIRPRPVQFAARRIDPGRQDRTRILLAEKDIVVANDLACEIAQHGAARVEVVHSLSAAMNRIAGTAPDLAVLNVQLQDELSYPAARRLVALGIPFVFWTSFDDAEILSEFRDVPRLSKPQNTKIVAECINGFVKFLAQGSAAPGRSGANIHAAPCGPARRIVRTGRPPRG